MRRVVGAVVLGLTMTGCSLDGGDTDAAPARTPSAVTSLTETAPQDGQVVEPRDARAKVPDVTHLRGPRPAMRALQDAGFAVKANDVECAKSDGCGLPLIDILDTDPAAGTRVRAGRTVTLHGYSVLANLYCCYNPASKASP